MTTTRAVDSTKLSRLEWPKWRLASYALPSSEMEVVRNQGSQEADGSALCEKIEPCVPSGQGICMQIAIIPP
jgi:hypothetical protein